MRTIPSTPPTPPTPRTRKVIIELRHSEALGAAAASIAAGGAAALGVDVAAAVPSLPGIRLDPSFPPVRIPGSISLDFAADPQDVSERFALTDRPEESTYIVRGEVPVEENGEGAVTALVAAAAITEAAVAVYADVAIDVCPVCPGDAAMGSD